MRCRKVLSEGTGGNKFSIWPNDKTIKREI